MESTIQLNQEINHHIIQMNLSIVEERLVMDLMLRKYRKLSLIVSMDSFTPEIVVIIKLEAFRRQIRVRQP